ncbi:toxin-antitoxin system HicB family antitoxin [Silvibacterium dinghuense]|uniref:Toxin-antitoxin system HicB family antitoxin n=1 Tax=Silvibacterium dinghuense TaxID=1560006 RepID=A0A4Q1S9C2_9BACT|nr:toxin-antitoxin system HicB family antitoxin [Silvibacterium dinghuense]RXS93640.1 toxin-antitoxin system HicB family antitoxin [Silvibacterium dinghuense]GGH06392.1 hypothetical protein GCM10011586_23190 [Silvibacterium dinghuense]
MADEYKRHHCFPLRLSPTMRQQAINLAEREGISLNHFITLAVAEKITRLEHVQDSEGSAPRNIVIQSEEEKPA